MIIERLTAALKKKRELKGISQSHIAKKLQTSKTAISRIDNYIEELGREPRLSRLIKYAKAMGYRLELNLIRDE